MNNFLAASTTANQDRGPRGKAADHRLRAMIALSRLGYASSRQLARIVWGKITASSLRQAQRMIAVLSDERLIVVRRDSMACQQMVALTASGVRWLSFEIPGDKAHARDWLRHAHAHRTACNSVFAAIGAPAYGYTELEIQSQQAPCKSLYHKVPDLLLTDSSGWTWIEVEHSYRSAKDFEKVIQWLRWVFHDGNSQVREVWFVITRPGASTISQRLQAALTHQDFRDGTARQIRELDSRILHQHLKIWRLDHDSLELEPVPLPRSIN